MKTFNLRLDELDRKIEVYLHEQVEQVISSYELKVDAVTKKNSLLYTT